MILFIAKFVTYKVDKRFADYHQIEGRMRGKKLIERKR